MSYYNIQEGLECAVKAAKANFIESVDLAIALNKKFVKSGLRGLVDLPCGIGKDVKIGVFADNEGSKEEAINAGASIVGGEDLIQEIFASGKVDCDWFLSTSSFMTKVTRISKILGPKGLMPNPKLGTVTSALGDMINKIKLGRIRFKSDSYGLIHVKIGSIDFKPEDLERNLNACLESIVSFAPVNNKNDNLIRAVYINTTMSKGSIRLKLN